MVEFGLHEWLSEYICQVFISWYIFKCNFPVFNHFSDKVILDINVLGPLMSLVPWYDSIPFYFHIFSISTLTLTYYDAQHQCDASHEPHEPTQPLALNAQFFVKSLLLATHLFGNTWKMDK